jgi:hypothetical protein
VEIISRLVMMILLMGVASLAGAVCAFVVYLLLRRANRRSLRASIVAGLFPPAIMCYLLACLVLSSVLSGVLGTPDLVFGDIREALPNGFTLEALDKMPECGHIQKPGDAIQVAWVGSVQVEGRYVLGKYDYTYFPKTAEEVGRNFFLLDTRSHEIRDFASESELAASAKTAIHLTPTPYFKGLRSPTRRISNILLLLIAVVPPLASGAFLSWRFLTYLRSE